MADRLTITAVVLVTFLATWVILVAMIPSGFLLSAQAYTPYDYPDYFTQQDIETIKYFITKNITYPNYGTEYDFDAEGASGTYVQVRWQSWGGVPYLRFRHETFRLIVPLFFDDMYFIRGSYNEHYIPLSTLQAFWSDETNVTRLAPVTSEGLSVTVFVSDPNSTRNDLEDAWDEGELTIGVGFGLDDWEAKYNSWTLIAKLLTFQAPEIDPLINGLIATPFWVATVLCIILIIVKFIPFTSS